MSKQILQNHKNYKINNIKWEHLNRSATDHANQNVKDS